MRREEEQKIKHWLKRKVGITEAVMVAFFISGGISFANSNSMNQEHENGIAVGRLVKVKLGNGAVIKVTPSVNNNNEYFFAEKGTAKVELHTKYKAGFRLNDYNNPWNASYEAMLGKQHSHNMNGEGNKYGNAKEGSEQQNQEDNKLAKSIAIGSQSVAKNAGIAIGDWAYAKGKNDTDENRQNNIVGGGVAIGAFATATASSAISLGAAAAAQGSNSIAIGRQSAAVKETSIAIGKVASAVGEGSLAFGVSSWSNGKHSLAIGKNSMAYKDGGLAFGASARSWGENAITIGRSTAIGKKSVVMGTHSLAKGDYSLSLGSYSLARGDRSVSLGYLNKAYASSSMAFGTHATAYGTQSISIGTSSMTASSAHDGIAIGTQAHSFDSKAISIGSSALAMKKYSLAIGPHSYSSGEHSIAVGESYVFGDKSVAMGTHNLAKGKYSLSLGAYSHAIGEESISLGYLNTSEAKKTITLGNRNKANNFGDIILGSEGRIEKNDMSRENGKEYGANILIGNKGRIDAKGKYGLQNIGIGNNVKIGENAGYAIAIGDEAKSNEKSSLAFGTKAEANATQSISIGTKAKSNKHNGIAIGTEAKSFERGAVALGKYSAALNLDSLAFGSNSLSYGIASIALGRYSRAWGEKSMALGADAIVDKNAHYGIAIGDHAKVRHSNNIALGAYSEDGNYGKVDPVKIKPILKNGEGNGNSTTEVEIPTDKFAGMKQGSQGKDSYGVASIGKKGIERQLQHVAAGRINQDSTDAINGSQLFAVSNKLAEGWKIANGSGMVLGNVTLNKQVSFIGEKGVMVQVEEENGKGYKVKISAPKAATKKELKDLEKKGIDFMGNDGKTIHRNLGQKLRIKGEGLTQKQSKEFKSAKGNINVRQNGKSILEIQLAKDINLGRNGSLIAGNTKIDKDGISFLKPLNGQSVTLSKNGLNNGGNKITNVGDGDISEHSREAINGGQLYKLKGELNKEVSKAITEVKDGKNIEVKETVGQNGQKVYEVDLKDKVTLGRDTGKQITLDGTTGKAEFGKVSVDGEKGTIGGLTNKTWNKDKFVSGQAATEDQLKVVDDKVNNLGKKIDDKVEKGLNFAANHGDTYNAKLGEKVSIKGNDKISKEDAEAKYDLENVVTTVDKEGNIWIKVSKNPKFNSIEAGSGDTKITIGNDGIKIGEKIYVTKDGINANNQKITNVADGKIEKDSKDAINGGQLHDALGNVQEGMNQINHRVDKLDDRMHRGLANAAAMSTIEFLEIGINQATVGAAVGTYRGSQAVAVGVQAAPTENMRVHAKVSVAPSRKNTETMAGVGASWRFNIK